MVKTCTHKRKTWNSLWTDVLLHSRLLGCLASRVHILLNKSVVCFPKLQKTTSHRLEGLLLFSHPVVSDSAAPWSAAHQASLSLTISLSMPKFMLMASVMPSSHLIRWHPLLLLPSVFPSIRTGKIRAAKCWLCDKYELAEDLWNSVRLEILRAKAGWYS